MSHYATARAADLQPGDWIDLGAETVTVHRVDPVRPGHIRIIGCLGAGIDPDPALLTVIVTAATASFIATREAVAA